MRILRCITVWLTGTLAIGAVSLGAAGRPNVVILLPDEWRAQAFGYAGDPNVHTPQIDRLQQESVQFVNAISPVPVCCPMRASFLTGQRVLTHGVFLNDIPLSPEAVTLGEVFKRAGYDTAYVGKWHLNDHGRASFIPRERRHGFDYWKVLECTHNYTNSFYYADTPERKKWDGYDAIAQTRDVQQFLSARARSSKPLFLILAWGPPHDPYQTAPQQYRDLYREDALKLRAMCPRQPSRGLARICAVIIHTAAPLMRASVRFGRHSRTPAWRKTLC